MFLLDAVQFRKRVTHRKPGRIAGIHTAYERIDRVVEEFATEPPQDEIGYALLAGTPLEGRDYKYFGSRVYDSWVASE